MRSILQFALLAMLAAFPLQSLAAQPPAKIPVSNFALLPEMTRPLLSPDGRRIVARTLNDQKVELVVMDAAHPSQPVRKINLGKLTLTKLHWAGNQHLLLTVVTTATFHGIELPILRVVAVDLVTQATRMLDSKSRGLFGGDVLYADPTGTWALVASQNTIFDAPSVKRVEIATGQSTIVEKSLPNVWDWFVDDEGVVRAGIAYTERRWTVWYREKAGEKFRAIRGKFQKDDSSVDRMIFGKDESGWIITNERSGRFGLYTYDFKNGTTGEAVFEHADVDIDEVLYDGASGKILGINYQDDRQRTKWFDPDRKALQERLDRALPDKVNVVVSWSRDESKALVWSASASDPGRYYLLDRTASRMEPVVDPYPLIEPSQLAEVKWVRYQARDGLSIPAYLTLPVGRPARDLPLIVMPHGGPFSRDEWEYDPFVQFLANRGYAVLQPQFRGSTGFGQDFVTRGYGQYGRQMQDDLDDGVDWLARSGQIDPRRVCIVGASYGGYAAMWGVARNPERYRCAASWAGVSNLPAQLRHDRKSFSATRYFREWRTKVAGGDKVDLDSVSPVRFADRIRAPLLIGHGEADKRVPVTQSRSMVEALSKAGADVTPVFYKESGHDFGNSADLEDWLRRLEAFLAKHNPAEGSSP